MAQQLHLDIVAPEHAAFSAPVLEVTLPGVLGQLGILPGHLPLMTALRPGEVTATTDEGPRHFAVGAGFAEIRDDRVTLLVNSCAGADQIDIDEARSAFREAEELYFSRTELTADELSEKAEELEKARARLSVIERATGGGGG